MRNESAELPLFGLPRTMSLADSEATLAYLTRLWMSTYDALPGADLAADLETCRRFFDPLLRGQTVRDRLSALPASADTPPKTSFVVTEPIVVSVDAARRLVGVEARLVIHLLSSTQPESGFVAISDDRLLEALRGALDVYRDWSGQRLRQVTALQQGTGRETLQAKSVGLVLALLVNRSTDPKRAVVPDESATVATGAEKAVFDAAEAFAAEIAERSERSFRENRLKGGYAATEARRRLPDFRIERDGRIRSKYFLAPRSEQQVIEQLAAELARRERITPELVSSAFDALVKAYRAEARTSSWLGGIHERPAETAELGRALVTAFQRRRAADSTSVS